MAKDPDEILIGTTGGLFLAPVGTVEPASISEPLGEDWLELGYTNEDGLKFNDGKTVEGVRVWQSFYDVRRFITERSSSVAFSLSQFSGANLKLAIGGGEVVEDAEGEFTFHPPEETELNENALACEWHDGDKDYRLILRRGMNEDATEFDVNRGAETGLPLTFSILGTDGVEPWILQTNDPSFAAAVGSGS